MSRRRAAVLALAAVLAAAIASNAQDAPTLGGQAPPRVTRESLPPGAAERFAEAVAAYERDDAAEAERIFREMVERGAAHPAVLVGLGNSAYRLGRFVEAVYAYEWARLLDPAAEDVAANLALARSHLISDVTEDEGDATSLALRDRLRRVPAAWTVAGFAVLWSLGWLVLAARQLGRIAGWTWAGVALLTLSLPLAAHAAFRIHEARGPARGVLQEAETLVRSGPGEDYAILFTLHAGALVESREMRSGWARVALARGPEGWVPAGSVALIGDVTTLR